MSRKQHDLTVNTGGEMGQILDHLLCASDPKIRRQDARDALRLHAALLAENERLKERLDRIDAFAGKRCEASWCGPDPCGPVEYHDVEGVPLCAECWQECLDEAAQAQEKKEVPRGE